jgi:hypothetical protein
MLAFVAPGIVHRFANVLLSIQGHAQLAAGDGGGDSLRAVLEATSRGGQALGFLRLLLGDEPPGEHRSAGELLAQVAELVRIPVREAGQQLRVEAAGDDDWFVDGGDFAVRTVAAVGCVLAAVREGLQGTVTLSLRARGPTALAAAVSFAGGTGSLPFPLQLGALPPELGPSAPDAVAGCAASESGLDLWWPAQARSLRSQA